MPRPAQPASQFPAVPGLLAPLCLLLLAFALPTRAQSPNQTTSQPPTVLKLTLHDTVQPVTADYLRRGLDQAASTHASAVLISLGTPGGLLTSIRDMVSAVEASPVPVIVFVEPAGSRAGSAGFFLLEAADIAAMAPGTNAGAAHPIIEGSTMDPVLKQKLENDTTAFLRSFISVHNRNAAAAEDAVLNSKSYSDTEALNLHLIDLIAPDDQALLAQLDNRTVHRFNGATQTLHLAHATVVPLPPSTRERLLTRLTSPDLDVLLLICGALLIYLEFHVPGTVVPGALGTLLLLLAVFGFNLLPIRHTAVLLLAAAFILILLEAKFTSHGILALAGVACLVFGLATLVDSPVPELRVHWATAIAAGIGFGSISAVVAWIALRARRNKRLLGPQAMLGRAAIVLTDIPPAPQPASPTRPTAATTGMPHPSSAWVGSAAPHQGSAWVGSGVPHPDSPTAVPHPSAGVPHPSSAWVGSPPPTFPTAGQVEVRGEIWQAVAATPNTTIPAGSPVIIESIQGLTLTVRPT